MELVTLAQSVGAALMLIGSAIVAFAGVGLIRLADPFMRMHAATKAGVVGAGLVMLGSGVASATLMGAFTGLAGLLFLLATAPIASHVLGRAAYIAGAPISPTTVQDALSGVLPRNVFDIDPARTVRRSRTGSGATEEGDMVAVQQLHTNEYKTADVAADPRALRRITAWLVGGENQESALDVAFLLAGSSGAALSAFTAIDQEAGLRRQAIPVGGGYWARWQAGQRRERLREQSAKALGDFQKRADETGVSAGVRHEEGGIGEILNAASSADLVVVPAGVDRTGSPAAYRDELAAVVASAKAAPVLRVNRAPSMSGRVAILVDSDQTARSLAQDYLRSGVYADADVTVLPVGVEGSVAESLAAEFAELLQAHGRNVSVAPVMSLNAEGYEVVERMRPFDVVVMNKLSGRGGWFSLIREDAHEIAADTAPMTLLI